MLFSEGRLVGESGREKKRGKRLMGRKRRENCGQDVLYKRKTSKQIKNT